MCNYLPILLLNKYKQKLRLGAVEVNGLKGIATTQSFRRAWKLAGRALGFREPVLLIGETACGKTSLCQLLALSRDRPIRIVNCHQSTETADIIGGLRPAKGRLGFA